MTTAYIAVDVQNDFLPGGSLAVPRGFEVVDAILDNTPSDAIRIASRDWHPADHKSFSVQPEFKDGSWPAHCVAGPYGAALHPDIGAWAQIIVNKGFRQDREAYSVFDDTVQIAYDELSGNTGQDMTFTYLLNQLDVDKVIIAGLAGEICVLATAKGAHEAGFWNTSIDPEGSRGRDQAACDAGYAQFPM